MFRIYTNNEKLAHAAGQHSEATKFAKLAQDCYTMYDEANREAADETIKLRCESCVG